MADAPARGALIGPGLYADIKRTIERVGGMPVSGAGITKIPTDLSGNDGGYVAPTFRIATFTGSWSVGSDKAVRLVADTARTVTATNLFWPGIAPTSTATSIQCSIAREGTAWTLVNVPLQTRNIVYAAQTEVVTVVSAMQTHAFVVGISVSAKLDTANCAISVAQTVTTQAHSLVTQTRETIGIASTATASFIVVGL